ncbi:MAG: hypothetical protein AB7V58_00925 [Solirubrobacterales bacterium]
MSDTTLRIDRGQRDSLHRLLIQRFTGIIDPGLMIKRGDFAEAERFGNELAADVRLLNDLGWDPGDGREHFTFTTPAEELLETLWRLRVDAEGGVDEPEEVRRGRAEDDELLVQHHRAREVCAELIARLDSGPGAA